MDIDENSVLVNDLIKGNEKAYIRLLDSYYRVMHTYAISLIRDEDMAKDIVQNVFLNTWRARKRLNPQLSIRSFLLKSVYNEFINIYRKDKAMLVLHKKYVEATKEVVEETSEKELNSMVDILNVEIKKLPAKCRTVFELSKKEGLTNYEISEYLNISSKTVEAQITKAFKILRSNLADKYHTFLLVVFKTFDNHKNIYDATIYK